jgi:imidazolonepropionase-like amidohydrolase
MQNQAKKTNRWLKSSLCSLMLYSFVGSKTIAQDNTLIVQAKKIYTSAGPMIENGSIVCIDGKIATIGATSSLIVPKDSKIITAEVVFPGLIDVRTCVGLSGILNSKHDSDQIESSSPIQPELRAIDAYNPGEELVEYIRDFGVTTIHTGHAPGELISGQTLIAKTFGNTAGESLLVDGRAVVATLAESSFKTGKQSPGTRGKQMAMLRALLIEAKEYQTKLAKKPDSKDADKTKEKKDDPDSTARSLKLEAMAEVLSGTKALLITADRSQDIASALRLAEEFSISIWLDSAAEAYLMIPQLKKAKVPVLLHPSMMRASGEQENLTFESAKLLHEASIPFGIQGGYEAYVPKVRVVLFEAAIAVAHGLPYSAAIESITIQPARILGIDKRVGSIEIGKDADLALYDGDPFEWTTHCTGVIVNGKIVSKLPR